MSDNKFIKNLSLDDLSNKRLKTAQENIDEMQAILSVMDELEELKKSAPSKRKEIEQLESSVGGYSRVEIVNLLTDLKRQRDGAMTDIEKERQALMQENAALKSDIDSIKGDISNLSKLFSKQVEFNRIDSRAEFLDSQNDNRRFSDIQKEIDKIKAELNEKEQEDIAEQAKKLKEGDNTLILESIYNSITQDLETFKKEVTQEIKLSHTQQQAIYEDLTEQLSQASNFDIKGFEEKLTEISAIKATDIRVLEERMEKLAVFDYDSFVDKVSERILGEISQKLLALPAPAMQAAQNLEGDSNIALLLEEIKEVKSQLSGIISSKEHLSASEFALLDYEIQEYLKDNSPIALADLLVDARNIKNKALKYRENGNEEKCGELISGLKSRLKNTAVSGSRAIEEILRISEQYNIALSITKQKLNALKTEFFKYEQGSIMPNFDLINDLIRLKKEVFKDPQLTVFDKQTFDEITAEASGLDLTLAIKGTKAEKLKALKKELASFNLACVFDFDLARVGSEITDTDLLLAEIKSLKKEISGGDNKAVPTPPAQEPQGLNSEIEKIKELAARDVQKTVKPRKKSQKLLRPSFSSNTVKSSAPRLATNKKPKTSLNAMSESDSLTNELVQKLAKNMASRLNKK